MSHLRLKGQYWQSYSTVLRHIYSHQLCRFGEKVSRYRYSWVGAVCKLTKSLNLGRNVASYFNQGAVNLKSRFWLSNSRKAYLYFVSSLKLTFKSYTFKSQTAGRLNSNVRNEENMSILSAGIPNN